MEVDLRKGLTRPLRSGFGRGTTVLLLALIWSIIGADARTYFPEMDTPVGDGRGD